MKKFILYISVIFLASACSKDIIKIDPDNLLLGTWTFERSVENTSVFTRSESFKEEHCYKFKNDGSLTERKNSGWCGTPPITYSDYSGTWSQINDTIVSINVGYWGGTTSYNLDIEKVSKDLLEITFLLPTEN